MKILKSLIIIVILLASVKILSAQHYPKDKPLIINLGASYVTWIEHHTGNGAGYYVEPRYALDSNNIFGLRYAWSSLNGGEYWKAPDLNIQESKIQNLHFTVDHLLRLKHFSPFVGIGAGFFWQTLQRTENPGDLIQEGERYTDFGFICRAGINFNRFRLGGMYNFTGPNMSNFFMVKVGYEVTL
ncbi:MAG: hypothetical protein K9I94_14050 [Bacteroidales bacterium]|nr:hypothetical protein [Bacteroidales bacterium]